VAKREIKLDTKEIEKILTILNFVRPYATGCQVPHVDRGTIQALEKKFSVKEKRIKVSSAKGKGRALQKAICYVIAKYLNLPFDNTDDDCLIHSRQMGGLGVDIELRGEARKRFPFDVECKAQENIALPAFWKQTNRNNIEGRFPLLVIKSKVLGKAPIYVTNENGFFYRRNFDLKAD